MKINGIDSINDTKIGSAIVNFIYNNFPNNDTIDVECTDEDDCYLINYDKYIFIHYRDICDIIRVHNDDLFEESALEDIRNFDKWEEFINKEKWISSYGIDSFEDFWLEVTGDSLEYCDEFNDIQIYKVCEE